MNFFNKFNQSASNSICFPFTESQCAASSECNAVHLHRLKSVERKMVLQMIAMWILCFHCALIHHHRATFESRPWKKLKRHFFFDSLRCVFRMMVCSACEMNLLKGSDISTMHIFSVYVWCRPQVSITNYSRWIITFNLQFYGTFRMVRRFRAVTLIEIFY